jgi:predicted phosphodiesterase
MKTTSYRALVMPDTHAPFHDPRAVDCFLEAAYQLQPNELVIDGDFTDLYTVSSHDKSPARRETMKDEIDGSNELLDIIEGMFGRNVMFIEGNHENRYDRYIAKHAPELYGLAPTIAGMLRLEQRGWGHTLYRDEYSIGKIDFTHDVGRSGAQAMQQSITRYGHNLVIGHTHRLGVAYQGTKRGGTMVCMNVGWLGRFDSIDYRQRSLAHNDWQHGFGYVDFDEQGNGYCVPVPIIDGRCKVEGRLVRG